MSLRHLADDADNPEEASDVRAALAEVLLVAALHGAPARRLARGESTALVLTVPGPDWVAPLATTSEPTVRLFDRSRTASMIPPTRRWLFTRTLVVWSKPSARSSPGFHLLRAGFPMGSPFEFLHLMAVESKALSLLRR